MLQRPLAIAALAGLLWLPPVQLLPNDPEDNVWDNVMAVDQIINPENSNIQPMDWGTWEAIGNMDETSDNHSMDCDTWEANDDMGKNSDPQRMEWDAWEANGDMGAPNSDYSMEPSSNGAENFKGQAAIAHIVSTENVRFTKFIQSYVVAIKNVIKALDRVKVKDIEVLNYQGKYSTNARSHWTRQSRIAVAFIYWNIEKNEFNSHVASFMYDELFSIDHNVLCINGIRPALVKVFGTAEIDLNALSNLVDKNVAGIQGNLGGGSVAILKKLSTAVKAYQRAKSGRTCTGTVYLASTGSASSTPWHKPKHVFDSLGRVTTGLANPLEQTANHAVAKPLKSHNPYYSCVNKLKSVYQGYLQRSIISLQKIQDNGLGVKNYVFAARPKIGASGNILLQGKVYLLYWDLDLKSFKRKIATPEEARAYVLNQRDTLLELLKGVLVLGRHFPPDTTWQLLNERFDATVQEVNKDLPHDWKLQFCRLSTAWEKPQQGAHPTGNE